MLSFYAGGEYLCLNVCEALQEMGYRVSLACDVFRPLEFERIYGMQGVMGKCEHIPIPQFRGRLPHLMAWEKLAYARGILHMFRDTDADIVFSTQSSPFVIPRRIFHFVYNVTDVYGFPPAAAHLYMSGKTKGSQRLYREAIKWLGGKLVWKKHSSSKDWFFAIGSGVLADLRKKGFRNSSFVFPPCRLEFKPRFPKKRQVVQATRIFPQKRLESFLDVASRLPHRSFVLIGRDDPVLRRVFPGYFEGIMSRLPKNVFYVDALLRERRDLLEESMVYLYTGVERGIGLALVEAIGAGCLPVCPPNVGASDIVRTLDIGDTYNTPQEAANKIEGLLKQGFGDEQFLAISEKAKKLGPQTFKLWIKDVVVPSTGELSSETLWPGFPTATAPIR